MMGHICTQYVLNSKGTANELNTNLNKTTLQHFNHKRTKYKMVADMLHINHYQSTKYERYY